MNKILLADSEASFRESFTEVLQKEGLKVTSVDNGADAINAVMQQSYPVVILDNQMSGSDGTEVLQEIMKLRPQTRVIMITAFGTIEMAVEAMKLGACDYVIKPVIFEDILAKIHQHLRYLDLQEENQELKRELKSKFDINQIIGQTQAMQQVFEIIRKVSRIKSNVLITGESGTGKELAARAIHYLDMNNSSRFIAVNCSAIPEGLIESELFGHKKGSFTSAIKDKKGLFESAHGGTLFLDEIGCMPLSCQVKLLRAVEHRQIIPVGSTEPVEIDLRLVAATNKNLPEEIKKGQFREDLYYRLNVVGIHIPPLRERKEDIPLLVDYFTKKYNKEMGKQCKGVSDNVMQILKNYEWKGNIRELQNIIERAVIFAEDDIIKISDIGPIGSRTILPNKEANENLHAAIKIYEREHICRILNKYNWNKVEAAKALKVGLSSLYRKIDELQVNIGKHQIKGKAS